MQYADLNASVAAVVTAAAAVLLSYYAYRFTKRSAALAHDNNLITYVDSVLGLIVAYPDLDDTQKRLLQGVLVGARYFDVTDVDGDVFSDSAFSVWEVDAELKRHFGFDKQSVA